MSVMPPVMPQVIPPASIGVNGGAALTRQPSSNPSPAMNPGGMGSVQTTAAYYPRPFIAPVPTVEGIPAPDSEIFTALKILADTVNPPQDVTYLQAMGINIIFENGRQALDVIRRHGAGVVFAPTGDPSAHAEWDAQHNRMVVNERYRGTMNPAILSGIAAAIYHEAGHVARLGDNLSSIQEELDCLGLNTMAYWANRNKFAPIVWTDPNDPRRPLFDNGLALYDRLFFDADPQKKGLVNRVIQKYGDLPPETPDHRIPNTCPNRSITELILYEQQRRHAGLQPNVTGPQPALAALNSTPYPR